MTITVSMREKTEIYRNLLAASREAFKNSYSPYSHFRVGAALLTSDGKMFTGCNVEVASYAGSICAERTALAKAVSEGFRNFDAIAVIAEKTYDISTCGLCRQLLREFAPDLIVISESADGEIKTKSLRELLPDSFGPEHLLG